MNHLCTMFLIDTHAHLYLDAFDADREAMVSRALDNGVSQILLPNISEESIGPMMELSVSRPGQIFPMMGLHPCDVKENFKEVLSRMYSLFQANSFIAVGETGIDLYWDKSTLEWQTESFRIQIEWAKELDLPLVIHARESFQEIYQVLDDMHDEKLRGVFHCFTGTSEDAKKIQSYGTFLMGIGGVITYEKSGLADVVKEIPTGYIILETDAPFLTPKPFRGKRNESSYLVYTAQKLADSLQLPIEEIARITTENARRLFSLPSVNFTT